MWGRRRSARIREREQRKQANSTLGESFPKCTKRAVGLNMGTINIMDGRGNRLELICHKVERHGIDIAILMETKLNGYHTVSSYGYSIMATKCSNQHQGGVAILARQNVN